MGPGGVRLAGRYRSKTDRVCRRMAMADREGRSGSGGRWGISEDARRLGNAGVINERLGDDEKRERGEYSKSEFLMR